MKGKFVTFEGCEGVGKTRQIKDVCAELDALGIKYTLVREPGGTRVSERIREIILDGELSDMTARCEALLYAASREQLINEVIAPRLSRGELVLCDRYIDSSFAYQGHARGLGFEFVEKINSLAVREFIPDLTLFLDLDPERAFKRKGGADAGDRLEITGLGFHKKVYEGYLELCGRYPDRIVSVDAGGTREETHARIMETLKRKGIIA